jgi:hypothetical protein
MSSTCTAPATQPARAVPARPQCALPPVFLARAFRVITQYRLPPVPRDSRQDQRCPGSRRLPVPRRGASRSWSLARRWTRRRCCPCARLGPCGLAVLVLRWALLYVKFSMLWRIKVFTTRKVFETRVARNSCTSLAQSAGQCAASRGRDDRQRRGPLIPRASDATVIQKATDGEACAQSPGQPLASGE